jgi:hypothetical protein
MSKIRICAIAVAIACCALLMSPGGITRADSLTGVVSLDGVGLAAGSTLTCPNASALCTPFDNIGVPASYAIGAMSLTFSTANVAFISGVFDFTGLQFASGGVLTGVQLITNISGLTMADVTFGANFVDINLTGLVIPNTGTFTLDLTSSAVPEPSSVALLGIGLMGVLGLATVVRRKALVSVVS